MRTLSLFLILFLIHTNTLFAQDTDTLEYPNKVIVGTKEAAPFVIKKEDGSWEGISIELWETMAEELNIEYEYHELDLQGLIDSTQQGNVDIAVAALTINDSREKIIDFSQPFYVTGLGIAARTQPSGFAGVLSRLFSKEFFSAVGGLIIVILIFGFFIWLFERKRNKDEFGGKAIHGIGSGFWWSAVTMTTVGYGDKAPVTIGGRIVALIWMFMALIIISSFTAAIASALTVNQLSSYIDGPEDLYKVSVGTVENSSSSTFLNERNIDHTTMISIEQCMEALEEERLDAVVYDMPIMRYLLTHQVQGQIDILPQEFKKVYYGMAFPEESQLKEIINIKILEIMTRPSWRNLLSDYLGDVDE